MADDDIDIRIPQPPFAAFRERLGFNLKEVAKAGALIGLDRNAAHGRHSGITKPGRASAELSLTERLAMSAVAAGLPPYRPDLHSALAALTPIIESHGHLRVLDMASIDHRSTQTNSADDTAA